MILKNARFSLDTMLKWQRRYGTVTEIEVKQHEKEDRAKENEQSAEHSH